MRNRSAGRRLVTIISVAGFLMLAAGLYEIDRRGKSTSATADRHLTELDLAIQALTNRIHILMAQLDSNERQMQSLSNQVKALSEGYESRLTEIERQVGTFIGQYDARLKELENDLRVRRLDSEPVPRKEN